MNLYFHRIIFISEYNNVDDFKIDNYEYNMNLIEN